MTWLHPTFRATLNLGMRWHTDVITKMRLFHENTNIPKLYSLSQTVPVTCVKLLVFTLEVIFPILLHIVITCNFFLLYDVRMYEIILYNNNNIFISNIIYALYICIENFLTQNSYNHNVLVLCCPRCSTPVCQIQTCKRCR